MLSTANASSVSPGLSVKSAALHVHQPVSEHQLLRALETTFDLGQLQMSDGASGGHRGYQYDNGQLLFGMSGLEEVDVGVNIPGEMAERLALLGLGKLQNGVGGGMMSISLRFEDSRGRASTLDVPRTPNGLDWNKARLSIMPMQVAKLAQLGHLGAFQGRKQLPNGTFAYRFTHGSIQTTRRGAVIEGPSTRGAVSLGGAYKVGPGDRMADILAAVEKQLRANKLSRSITHADLARFFPHFNHLAQGSEPKPGKWLRIPTVLEVELMMTPAGV